MATSAVATALDLTAVSKTKESMTRQETAETTTSTASTSSVVDDVTLITQAEAEQKEETTTSTASTSSVVDDVTLISQAEAEQKEERYLVAADLLKQVQDTSLLQDKHRQWMKWAEKTRVGMKDLLESPEGEDSAWIKQSETHGNRDFLVYYQVSDSNQLLSRIDCAIESSLLEPLIAVLNESDLYKTWMPAWKRPVKLGVHRTKMLKETGRGNQIIQITVNMAWPFKTREVVQHAVAVDVIDQENAIAVAVFSEEPKDDPCIPEPEKGVVRMDFECSIVIRACPPDHVCLAKSKNKYPADEPLILVSLKNLVDAHVKLVPVSMINFMTRTVLGTMWASLLGVAEAVRDGKRPVHAEAVASKRELYDWLQARLNIMLAKVKEEQDAENGKGNGVEEEAKEEDEQAK
jgi:hypothetical protein